MNVDTQKKMAAGLSIASNASIIILKIVAGFVSGSISIISEAIHSFSDFLASALTFFAVSRSSEPPDKEHPFGHGKYEEMSGFIEGGLIIFAGVYIIYEATKNLIFARHSSTEPIIGIVVMGISVVANFLVSSYLFYIAKKSDSVSLYADAEHLRTDIWSALGVLIGLLLIKITGYSILDPIIAIFVAAIIIHAGLGISKETLNNLLDGSLPNEEISEIEILLSECDLIKGYKDLKARKSGQHKAVEVTIFFEPTMTICQCHDVCDKIEGKIKEKFKSADVTIHAEPVITAQSFT